ncbi:MAG: hypothetical protein ABIO61_07710, partial [Thermomonas sp.]
MKSLYILFIPLILLACGAHGEVLYKCVSGTGNVSWQSGACQRGTRTMRSLAYEPEIETPISTPLI